MGRRWSNWSLRTQLSLAVAAIMLLLLTLFSMALYVSVRSFINAQTTTQLQLQARALLRERADGPTSSGSREPLPTAALTDVQRAELQELAAALTSSTTSVVVYQADGTVLAQSAPAQERRHGWRPGHGLRGQPRQPPAPPEPPAPPRPNDQAFDQVLRGADVSFRDYDAMERQLAVLMPVYDGSYLIGVLQISTSLRPTDALLRWLVAALIGGTLLVSLTALVLSLWATRVIIDPLRRLVGVTQQVGQGDLAARSNLHSHNEIGALGRAFDQMVARLQATFAVQRRFIADAAHELRTPLTAVGGQLELLMLGAVSDPTQQRRTLQRMNGELERMGRLVDDLLTLSRLDARPALRREVVDLALLAQDVAQQEHLPTPDHQLTINATPSVRVIGDPDRLRQVFLNVLDNARKYTPPDGSVRVTVEQRAGEASVAISDTGVGIPADDVAHVWDRFYRVDQARTRTRGGAGLGLAIVKGIVEAHGGTATLTSTPGSGTTVTLSFPLAADDTPTAGQSPTASSHSLADVGVRSKTIVE